MLPCLCHAPWQVLFVGTHSMSRSLHQYWSCCQVMHCMVVFLGGLPPVSVVQWWSIVCAMRHSRVLLSMDIILHCHTLCYLSLHGIASHCTCWGWLGAFWPAPCVELLCLMHCYVCAVLLLYGHCSLYAVSWHYVWGFPVCIIVFCALLLCAMSLCFILYG